MHKHDSKNGINHKCPCCGYEVDWDWNEEDYIKGNESFIKIENSIGRTTAFETDVEIDVDWGDKAYEKVCLLGCPKCKCVSFKFD